MALLFCHLLLLFSKTLLPAERPLRYSGRQHPTDQLQACNRHQEWTGGGPAFPLYKHRLLVNLGALNRNMSWPPLFLSSFSPIQLLPPTQESSYCGRRRLHAPRLAQFRKILLKRAPQHLRMTLAGPLQWCQTMVDAITRLKIIKRVRLREGSIPAH